MRKIFSEMPVFFLLCLGLVIFFEVSIPLDYCRSANKTFSDQEFIEIAIAHEIKAGNLKLSTNEMTPNDFYSNHPQCCEVVRTKRTSIYSVIFEPHRRIRNSDISVKMIYEMNKFNLVTQSINFDRFIEAYLGMSSCGDVTERSTIGRKSLDFE